LKRSRVLFACAVTGLAVFGGATSLAAEAAWQRLIRVEDPCDLGREAWPILVRVDTPDTGVKRGRLRVFAKGADGAETVVPSQLIDVADPKWVLPGLSNGTVEICFLADLKPKSVSTFVLRIARGKAEPPTNRLTYEGGGFGIKVDTGPAMFTFHPLSGQLCTYRPKLAGIEQDMYFRQGADRPCHWNPDVWVDGRSWGHTSDWNCESPATCPEMAIVRGDLAFRMVRRGRMWSAENVQATVSYTAFAGMPFLLESSEMEFTAATAVRAIRHNELVFSRGFHTEAIWPDEQGVPRTTAIYNKPDPKKFLGIVQTVSPDIPWLGLLHDEKRYGIGIVNFFRREATINGSSAHNENARYYFLDYGAHGTGERYDYNFAYMCRALYYEGTRRAPVQIQAGAVYEERSAFLVFALGTEETGRYTDLLKWVQLLREPPIVTVE